jgi:site-specific DNA recombinase
VSGRSPKQIVKTLNQQGVAGPFGGKWSPSTVYGHAKRGTGVLNNELYVGRMVWNRLHYTRNAIARTGKLSSANRPRYLFSGLTKCGVCGAGFIMGSANRLCCFGARDQGTCSNKLTIRRDEVEARALKALQEKLLRQDLFEEFCDEFTREMNRLRMEHRASLSAAEREFERVQGVSDA